MEDKYLGLCGAVGSEAAPLLESDFRSDETDWERSGLDCLGAGGRGSFREDMTLAVRQHNTRRPEWEYNQLSKSFVWALTNSGTKSITICHAKHFGATQTGNDKEGAKDT